MSGFPSQLGLIDAFTASPFRGNPAAVCLLPPSARPQDDWLRSMAVELNQAATAFLARRADGDGFDLRWFTVKNELELCGHGTLASTHFLWERGLLKTDELARYHTRAGILTAKHDGVWIEMDFPAKPVAEVEAPEGLQVAVGGAAILYVRRNQLDLFVELASEQAVRELTPNLDLLARIDMRGLIVTARGTTKVPPQAGAYDCVSRFFAPRLGLPEDSVTGSAHCALAPYWAAKLGKPRLQAYQASARGGVLRLRVDGDRVKIGGQAVTVWKGEIGM